MKLDTESIRRLCETRGVSLSRVLRDAGISRTAYYSLRRRGSVLPKTVLKLADTLDAPAAAILDETASEEARARRRIRTAQRIAGESSGTSFENVLHTLALLDLPPSERLNMALRRGRARTIRARRRKR